MNYYKKKSRIEIAKEWHRKKHERALAGENVKGVKLTSALVRQMRKSVDRPHQELANRFGVSLVTVSRVMLGKTWEGIR